MASVKQAQFRQLEGDRREGRWRSGSCSRVAPKINADEQQKPQQTDDFRINEAAKAARLIAREDLNGHYAVLCCRIGAPRQEPDELPDALTRQA